MDDVPLIWAHLEAMGIAEEIDAHFHPHGNRNSCLSLGKTVAVWLTYILSQGDHRMSAAEGWVAGLRETWCRLVSSQLKPEALCDDRLARALRYLAQDEVWEAFEEALNRRLLRVCSLALRALTLLEHEVRRRLARTGKVLRGLYEGNPQRSTPHPTAERLLRAFKGLHLSIVRWGEQVVLHISPLASLQKEILRLLGFSEEVYLSLTSQSPEPP